MQRQNKHCNVYFHFWKRCKFFFAVCCFWILPWIFTSTIGTNMNEVKWKAIISGSDSFISPSKTGPILRKGIYHWGPFIEDRIQLRFFCFFVVPWKTIKQIINHWYLWDIFGLKYFCLKIWFICSLSWTFIFFVK